MDSELWKRASDIFAAALDKEGAERETFLTQACLGTPELRQAVDDMFLARADSRFMGGPSAAPAGDASPLPAQRLGEFELRKLIGHGGSASVYSAWQPSLQREVALKLFEARLTTPERDVERFHREARNAAQLNHPGIVQVYAEGRADPLHYFAMELVHGHDLRQELIRLRDAGPGAPSLLPPFQSADYVREAARVCRDAARALGFAHARHIVHRDVKPANIFLRRGDLRVQVGDFGLSRDESIRLSVADRTQTHVWAGTLPYMSPEQTVALTNGVGRLSDIYSLGVVLYELLTLTPPFTGDLHELIRQIRKEDARPVRRRNPRVPRDLALVVHKALEKVPRRRYQAADLLADDLDRFLTHQAVHVRPASLLDRALRWNKRHWLRNTVVATAAIMAAFGAMLGTQHERHSRAAILLATARQCPSDERQFTDASPTDLADIYRATTQLGELALSDADARDVAEVRARLDAYCRDLVASAEATVSAVKAEFAAGRVAALDLAAVLKAQEDCRRAALVLGDPSPLKVTASSMLPTLTVNTAPDLGAGQVAYCRIDPITGQPGALQSLGNIPAHADRLPPGPVRIVVRFATGALREYTRYVSIGAPSIVIQCTPAKSPTRTSPLVPFTPGPLVCPDEKLPWAPLADRSIDVAPFELEQYEVTVGQFRDFLTATSRVASGTLALLIKHADIDDLPVTGITWEEARDYAEWLGLRLPTYAELTFATRGPTWAAWPSVDSTRGVPLGNVAGPSVEWGPLDTEERINTHLQHVRAYNSPANARSPEGVFHLAGNVAEWVEGPAPDLGPSGLVARADTRMVMNGDWSIASRQLVPHTAIESRGPGPAYTFITHGFRCARTRN